MRSLLASFVTTPWVSTALYWNKIPLQSTSALLASLILLCSIRNMEHIHLHFRGWWANICILILYTWQYSDARRWVICKILNFLDFRDYIFAELTKAGTGETAPFPARAVCVLE